MHDLVPLLPDSGAHHHDANDELPELDFENGIGNSEI